MFEVIKGVLGIGSIGRRPEVNLHPTAASAPGGGPVPRISNRAAYEAGSRGRRAEDWNPPDAGANMATASAATIRTRCRDAMRNDSWARAIIETLVDDVIGWGVKPLSRAKDEPFRQALQALWDDWSAVADADGVLDLAGLQAMALRNMLVDGECFIRLRRREPGDGLPVPLQLQVLPAEICPSEHTSRTPAGNHIKSGIEYDAIGRRVAYWFRETAPGDDDFGASASLHRVPAAGVLQLFEPLRPGQRRGVSALAPSLVRLRELDKYTDATLLRLQLSALFVAIKKVEVQHEGMTLDPLTGQEVPESEDGKPVLRLEPGTFQELWPGESLDFSKPPDPPVGFEAFVQHELRAAGAALGVPLEAFTHDWGATNDRLARVVLNQYRRRVHRLLWTIVVPQVLRPLWRTWFALARASEALPNASIEDASGRVTFVPHAHAYVHPVQDVQSYKEAIRSGLTSRAAAVSETGEDVEMIDAQIASDNARADKLGLRFDSDGRAQKGGAQ